MPFDITWSQEVSGGPMSSTWLSHLRGSGLTPGQSTKTLSATWLVSSHEFCDLYLRFYPLSTFILVFTTQRSMLPHSAPQHGPAHHTGQDRQGLGARWGRRTWRPRAVVVCPALSCLQRYLGTLLRPALAPGGQAALAPQVLTGSPS